MGDKKQSSEDKVLEEKANGLYCDRCDEQKWEEEYAVEMNRVEKPPIKKIMFLCKTCVSRIREYGHKVTAISGSGLSLLKEGGAGWR